MASVRKIADEVAMLHEGKIVWRGHPAGLDEEMIDKMAAAK